MTLKKKKVILTVVDIVILLAAGYWVLWLCFYYGATIDGAIYISSPANIFERNYLVPIQIFGISAVMTAATIILYRKLRIKKIIGRKYMILALFNTLPFWYFSIMQIDTMIYYWDRIY